MQGHAETAGRRERVLLVDDASLSRDIGRAVLESAGWDVEVAADGEQALASVKTRPAYDVLLMDLEMPVLDGFGSAVAIRRLGGARGNVPILALSSGRARDATARALTAGMDGYIGKPFDPRSLSKTMRDLMTASRPDTGACIFDRETFDEFRDALKPPRFDRIVHLFEGQLVQARAVARARPCDRARLQSVAHGLVGSAGMLGFVELLAVCKAIHVPDDGSPEAAERIEGGAPSLANALQRALGVMAALAPPPRLACDATFARAGDL